MYITECTVAIAIQRKLYATYVQDITRKEAMENKTVDTSSYKRSYYNLMTYVPEENAYVLYNTFHQSLTVLSPEEKSLYERVENLSPIELEDATIQELALQGFILENPQSDADYLRYQHNRYKFNDRVFELLIMPTMECNFNCAYCSMTRSEQGVDFVVDSVLYHGQTSEAVIRTGEVELHFSFGNDTQLAVGDIVHIAIDSRKYCFLRHNPTLMNSMLVPRLTHRIKEYYEAVILQHFCSHTRRWSPLQHAQPKLG